MSRQRKRQLHIREITLHRLASAHPHVINLHHEEAEYTHLVMDYAYDRDLFSQIPHNSRYFGDDFLIKHIFLQILDVAEHCYLSQRAGESSRVDSGLRVAITCYHR
jgi:serine/threonine protein kinase